MNHITNNVHSNGPSMIERGVTRSKGLVLKQNPLATAWRIAGYLVISPVVCFWPTQGDAQLTLTGGTYTETFDSIGSGLPTGWTGRTGASATALGTSAAFTTGATSWADSGGSFKNVAANDSGLLSSASTAAQAAATDRAFGIRQSGTVGDPGAAFTLQIGNTTGLGDFALSVNLEMLSVQTRSTTWTIQYGVGSSPTTFTTLGTYSDPGAFGSTPFTLSGAPLLGIANQSENVWIRLVALTSSTGSGSRDTFAIDDFSLTYAPLVASNYIFDIDGAVSGSGNPTGTYDFSSANWSSSAAGDVATGTFTGNQVATFAAGTDGTAAYTVTVDSVVSVAGLSFEEGNVTLASGAGTLTLAGAGVAVASGATATISEPLLGSVGLSKSGPGTLVLTGSNSYTGLTSVGAGTLSVSADPNLGDVTADIALGGGTLQTTATINLDAGRELSGSGALSPAASTTLTFNGAVNAGTVTIADTGTVAFANATSNSVSGLAFSAPGTVNASGGALAITGTTTALVTTHTTGTATVSGSVNLGSGTRTFTVADGSADVDLQVSANLSGAAVIAKLGSGTLSLTGNNSSLTGTGTTPASLRMGAAAVSPATGGTVAFDNVNALGTAQLQLNGGTLRNDAGSALVMSNSLSIGAQDHANTPGGMVFSGTNTEFTGGASLFKASGANYQHMITVTNTTTFSGVVGVSTGGGTSTGLTVAGAGKLVFSGASPNTFTEALTVGDGVTSGTILEAAKDGALGGNTGITVSSGGTLLLSGGAGDHINKAASLNLSGGTFDLGGVSEVDAGPLSSTTNGLGALTLSSTSTLDFGTFGLGTSIVQFGGVGTQSGILQVTDFDFGIDRLLFSGEAASFTSLYDQSEVSFNGGPGYQAIQFGTNEYFEIVPVPEPATIFGALGLLGLVGYRERRRVTAVLSRFAPTTRG